ncbi:MAG: cobalamin B12-binding domain-containing protein [bacterium]
MSSDKKRVLLAPLDPVHDIGLKMVRQALDQAGHSTLLLPPDYTAEEIINIALEEKAEFVLVSRTLGYGIAELLGRFIDLADASGLREKAKLIVGGMAIRPELAAELGFDAGFGPGTDVEEAVAYIEGRHYQADRRKTVKTKRDFTTEFSYAYRHRNIAALLDRIANLIFAWAADKTSPGINRALIRREMLAKRTAFDNGNMSGAQYGIEMKSLRDRYRQYSDDVVRRFYDDNALPKKTRFLTAEEQSAFQKTVAKVKANFAPRRIQSVPGQPLIFVQYGTGCPFMDIAHIKTSEAWGADGILHFDPSWGARTEGLLEGYIAHEEDGSILTPENLRQIGAARDDATLWTVRAHRGLNTPETVVLAGAAGADLTKINIVYGSLGAGTNPERLTVDGLEAIRLAVEYGLPYDIPTNEELCGVPAFKAFAGMLIVAHLGLRLGARPILKPLFCYSPEVMLHKQMEDNYIDYNAAKIMALQSIADIPVWPGEPIGFLTHSEDRVQSSLTTALHASLAASLGVPAISIASSDEAYSGGPITVAARIDTLRATQDAFRFLGSAAIRPTSQAEVWAAEMTERIEATLDGVLSAGGFIEAVYDGVLGSREDGAYPGRTGQGTVTAKREMA